MTLHLDDDKRLVRLTRTSQPFESSAAIVHCFDTLITQLNGIDRGLFVQLLDLRSARGRNDPDFEKTIAIHRKRTSTGFRKLAVVVRTLVGRMQVERFLQEDGIQGQVFLDEQEALTWLEA